MLIIDRFYKFAKDSMNSSQPFYKDKNCDEIEREM